jgi:hypothetical protein
MHPAVRLVISVICGALVAFALVAGIEAIGARMFPAPPGVDLTQPSALESHMSALPPGLLLFVVAAWVVATFVGALVASAIAQRRVVLVAAIVGILVLAATVANFVMIPHPPWMVVAGVAGILIAALAAGKVMTRRRAPA